MRISILAIVLLISAYSGSTRNLDSLWQVWSDQANSDTARLSAIHWYAWDGYLNNDPDSCLFFASIGFAYAHEVQSLPWMVKMRNIQGISCYYKSDYNTALSYYKKCIFLTEGFPDEREKSGTLMNMGVIYQKQGEYATAIDYFTDALTVAEQFEDKSAIANCLINIGLVHYEQEDADQAIDYYLQSLEIRKSINDQPGIASCLGNIGMMYKDFGDTTSAIDYYQQSLSIWKEMESDRGISIVYNNLGNLYLKMENYSKAQTYLHKALIIFEALPIPRGISMASVNIGRSYHILGKIDSAKFYIRKGLSIAKEIDAQVEIRDASISLYEVYKQEGDWEKALTMYTLYVKTNDSIHSENNVREVIKQETKHEFEKNQLKEQQVKIDEIRIKNEQLGRRDSMQYSVILICLLLVFGSVLALGFIKVSQRIAEGLIFFFFLILFEFMLVLADPYVDLYSKGAPGYKLLFNAFLAGAIFPLHAWFEHHLKIKLLRSDEYISS